MSVTDIANGTILLLLLWMVRERVRPYVRGMNARVKIYQKCHIQLFVCFRYYILLLSSYRCMGNFFRVFVESKFKYREYGRSVR